MKKLAFWIVGIIFLSAGFTHAQDTLRIHSGCGFRSDSLLFMGVDSPGHGATAAFTKLGYFPPSAIKTCGKFKIYYEDLIPGAPAGGFNEPLGVGTTRQNTLCAVLTYIQDVFDFSRIPPNEYINLHVDRSWSDANPMPPAVLMGDWGTHHGVCSPFFKSSSIVPGAVLNGFVHDYITTGTDPNAGDYHANLKMNFFQMDRSINDFSRGMFVAPGGPRPQALRYNDGLADVSGCQFDLYSVLLHLVSHSLGWFSWKENIFHTGVGGAPQSNFDGAISILKNPNVTPNPFASIAKLLPIPPSFPGYAMLNDKQPPYNCFLPGYDPIRLNYHFSHLLPHSFTIANRITPGDLFNPVMTVYFQEGNMFRTYSKEELLHFKNVIGLPIRSGYATSHSTLLNNRIPWSSKMNSDTYNFTYLDRDFPETVTPDFTLTNDIGSSLVIDLTTDLSLKDDDGDPLSVMPGTLVNFRGCGNGGNNHYQLVLSAGNQQITYTPRHNFYGRAQFGFNLWDGKEKGGFVIYTIDVLPGTNVAAPTGTEMIVNGTFEEGDEVKTQGSGELINNSFNYFYPDRDHVMLTGRFGWGTILSDGHPYDVFSNYFYGTAIRNSFTECSSASNNKTFGHPANSFPWPASWIVGTGALAFKNIHNGGFSAGFPDSKPIPSAINNRYQPLGQDGILLNLAETLNPCSRYILEFDARRTYTSPMIGESWPYPYPAADQLILDCTTSALVTDLTTITSLKNYTFPIAKIDDKNWEHFKVSFTYCGTDPANVLRFKIAGAFANNEYLATVLVDNVSLIETPLGLSIKIIDEASGCNHTLYAGPPSVGCPSLTYQWKNAAGVIVGTSRELSVTVLDNTFYTVTVSDGCSTATDRIDLIPCRCAPSVVLGTPYTTLTSGSVPAVLAPGNYYIPSDLSLSGSTTLNGAIVLIEPGVQITVPVNTKLTIDNTHLFTCPDTNKVWKGINLQSVGGVNSGRIEIKNNSFIEDAYIGVKAVAPFAASSGNIVDIQNTIFNRNNHALWIESFSPATPLVYPFSLKSTVVTGRNLNVHPGYPFSWPTATALKTTYGNTTATAPYVLCRDYVPKDCKNNMPAIMGLRLLNVGYSSGSTFAEVQIGDNSDSIKRNLFDRLGDGIVANNTNLTVYNSVFANMILPIPGVSLVSTNATGINAMGPKHRLQVFGAYVNSNLTLQNCFYDCNVGINANVWSLNATMNLFQTSNTTPYFESRFGPGLPVGIRSSSSKYVLRTADQNKFYNVPTAILFSSTNEKDFAFGPTNITANVIQSQVPPPVLFNPAFYVYQGIALDNVALTTTSGTSTGTNNIANNNLLEVYNGIASRGVNRIASTFTNNYVTIRNSGSNWVQYGFCFSDNKGGTVGNQNVRAIGNTASGLSGVAGNEKIRGFYAAFNSYLKLCNNNALNVGRGFEFGQTTPQLGIRWIDNRMENNLKGMILGSDIGHQGLVNDWGTLTAYYGATLNRWTGLWGSGKWQTYGENLRDTRNSKLWVRSGFGAVELPVTNFSSPGSIPYYYYSTSLPTTTRFANCEGEIFPTKYGSGPIGKPLALLVLADSLGGDPVFNRNQWMAQLALYEMAFSDSSLRDSSDALDTFMTAATASRFHWLMQVEQALADSDVITARSLLATPQPALGRIPVNPDVVLTDYTAANTVMNNYTDFYNLYLHYLQDSLDNNDTTQLEILAHKCPAKDGAVVYQARALYSLLSGNYYVYDDDSCKYDASGNFYRIAPNSEESDEGLTAYSLYPNPNGGNFSIRQSVVHEQQVSVKVYSAIGSQVYQSTGSFVNGSLKVSMGQQAQGLYLICIDDGSGKNTCLRFVLK